MIIYFFIGVFTGICVVKLAEMIFRAKSFTGYLVIAKNKHNEIEGIFADLNVKPEQIKPSRWIHMRTQEVYLKEEDK